MSEQGSSRRDFLKGLIGGASRRAPALLPSIGLLESQAAASAQPAEIRALAAAQTASAGDLRRMAEEAGLGEHLSSVQALARSSLRLTVGRPVEEGAEPAGVAGAGLLRVRLGEEQALAAGAAGLAGTLTFTFDADGACDVALADSSQPTLDPGRPLRGVSISRELVLPRPWSEAVSELGLRRGETSGWIELREHLAAFQGTELPGEEDEPPVIHRLLGYPDDRVGDMPLACELAAQGIENDDPPFAHPRAAELAPAAARWALLLQLSCDRLAGWSWGVANARLYVWVDRDDLAAGDLSRTRAMICGE